MTQTFGAIADANEIRSDERLIALFAHLSLFLGGILLPVIFWVTNRDKSKFIVFHSLQALWFHIAYIALILVFVFGFVIVAIIGGVGMGAFAGTTGSNEMPVFFIIAMAGFYILLFAIIFGAIGYSIYMGIKSYKGELVRYPFIGKKVYEKVYGVSV
jgi:uncharacterized Tic20 family protein